MPSTDKRPLRMHSVRPVPRTITCDRADCQRNGVFILKMYIRRILRPS